LPPPPAPESWDLSPDGRKIVSVSAASGGGLVILDLENQKVQTLQSDSLRGLQSVAWLADGWMITRPSGSAGGQVLYVNPSGTAKTLWSSAAQRLLRPVVSPDRLHVAFSSGMIESTAWMMEMAR
jgi:Tol biopolymer transport system component